MTSADSHYAMCSPYGLLTRRSACCRVHIFVFLSLSGQARRFSERDYQPTPGLLFNRLPLYSGIFTATARSRRSGSPGVNSGYFQRTIVRYTWLSHMTDRGLRLVLQTRPCGLTPPHICLPSTLSGTGHTCSSTRAFASGFLQAHIAVDTLAFGYPSPPSG